MATRWGLSLLGGFSAEVDGRRVEADEWRSRRAADLLKLLALAPGHRLHRERVMDQLWPSLSPEAAGANLRKAVHFARRALGHDDLVATASGVVALGGDVAVDAVVFESEADAALEDGDPSACARALEGYEGDLLPDDAFEPWSDEPRERLRSKRIELLRACGRWDRVVELDPTDEPAHRALIERHIARGDRTAAIRQFERLRSELNERLGVAPDPTTVALYERVLGMEGPEPPTPLERVQALLAWGLVHRNRMELDDAERHAQAARDLALQAGLGHELGEASTLLAFIAFARGTWEDSFRREFRGTLGDADGLAMAIYDAHLCFAEFSMYGPGGPERAERYARELLGIAADAGFVAGEGLARLLLGEILMVAGDLDAAEAELARADELYERCGCLSGRSIALERSAEAEIFRGRTARAKAMIRRALPLARRSGIPGHLVIRVYGVEVGAQADARQALDVVRRAERELSELHVCEPCSMGYRVNASIAGSRAGALDLSGEQLEIADRIAGMWQGGPWVAAVWEARAELRLAQGEPTTAAALWLEAADRFSDAERPHDAARCRTAADALAAGA